MKKQRSPTLPLSLNHKKRQRELDSCDFYSFSFSSPSYSFESTKIFSSKQNRILYLCDLPDEILLNIIEFLSIQQLSILAQVNKRFYFLTKDGPTLKRKFPYVVSDSPVSKKSKISPEPSLCHTAAVWGNKMWVHGGHNTIPNTQLFDDVKKNFHYFDLSKNMWRKVKAKNCPRKTEHSSLIYGNKLYMFGGYSGCEFTNSLYCYDFLKRKWKEVPTTGDIPSPRSAHVGVVYNEKMYIFGGWNGKVQNNDFFEFDFASSTWTQILPPETNDGSFGPSPRCSHAGVVVSSLHKFYIFGGCGGNPVTYNSELWAYDFLSKKWTMETTPISPRSRMKMVEWNNYLYIYGGWNRKDHFFDLFEYDIAQSKWRPINYSSEPSFSFPSEQYSVIIHNNMLYIYGGYNSSNNSSCNQLTTIRLWFPEEIGVLHPNAVSSSF